MTDRIPGAPGRCKALVTGEELQKLQSGEEFAITLRRDDQPIKAGTPYSKASLLPDDLAQQLCPNVEDPTPADAFAALQTGKADRGRRKTGTNITLQDAIQAPLQGLKIFGFGNDFDNAGIGGSITVKLGGKNLADIYGFSAQGMTAPASTRVLSNNYGTTLSTTEADNTLVVTQSSIMDNRDDNYGNGYFCIGFYNDLKNGDKITLSFDVEITNNLSDNDNIVVMSNGATAIRTTITTGRFCKTLTWKEASTKKFIEIRNNGKSMIISNIQVEYGTTATDYAPYVEPQTITVPTTDSENIVVGVRKRDVIDFEKGVLYRESFDLSTPLPAEVMEAYANLHTYKSYTVITNDAGAEMEVCYCTDTTAVPMVYSAAACGKFLAINSFGAVSPHTVAAYVEHTEKNDGWDSRIWSDGFAEMHKKDTVGEVIGQNGICPISYMLPFPVDSDCTVQVTPLGNVNLIVCEIVDMTLRLVFAGQAGTSISDIHISLMGRVRPEG